MIWGDYKGKIPLQSINTSILIPQIGEFVEGIEGSGFTYIKKNKKK